ncbi:MAG: nucleotidyl transferase AbiEii/AbiGii toxin family protein [Solirubrobacteraceae bacterium]
MVPVIDIAEHAAEKIVGWAAASLMRHYLDLAWIGREYGDTIEAEGLRELVRTKLKVGHEAHPDKYKNLRELKHLLVPLTKPGGYFGPLNSRKDTKAKEVRFMGNAITPAEAQKIVRDKFIPLLYG